MSSNIKRFLTGLGIEPVSADPSNPVQGQLQYADGTVRAEGLWRYDGSAWQQVGSGAGSYDIFYQENLETNTASNFTTGQNASPDAAGTGTLGGALANEESSQISGDRSLKYTMNATAGSSDNDFFINDTDIALDVKHRGNSIGVTFYYTYNGDDDDIRFFVLDQDDNELTQSDEYIKSASTATRFSTSVFVPSASTGLRYGFQVVTGNSSKVFIVDDIEFSTNPFVYKNLIDTQYVRYQGIAGYGSTNTKIPYYTNERASVGSGIYSIENDSTNGFSITMLQNARITVHANFYHTNQIHAGLTLNSSELTTNIHSLTTDSSKLGQFGDNGQTGAVTVSLDVEAGDVIRPHTNGVNPASSKERWVINVLAQTEAEHVVTPAKVSATNLEGYSPALVGVGTTTNQEIKYKLEGDMMTIQGRWTNGTVSATEFQLPLPSGYTIASDYSFISIVGDYQRSAAADTHYVALATAGDSFLNIGYRNAGTNVLLTPQNGNAPWGTGDAITVNATFKVEEGDTNATFLAAIPMNYTQTKYLTSSVLSSTDPVTDLTFNNLVIGKRYKVYLKADFQPAAVGGESLVYIKHDGSVLDVVSHNNHATTGDAGARKSVTAEFTATATTVTFDYDNTSGMTLRGSSDGDGTYARITELNYTKETTRFT